MTNDINIDILWIIENVLTFKNTIGHVCANDNILKVSNSMIITFIKWLDEKNSLPKKISSRNLDLMTFFYLWIWNKYSWHYINTVGYLRREYLYLFFFSFGLIYQCTRTPTLTLCTKSAGMVGSLKIIQTLRR